MTIPDRMKAIEIRGPGGPEMLVPATRPLPPPSPGEVLIKVWAAGVNGHDIHHRKRGHHPIMNGESDLPGLEVSGEVVACGVDVSGFRPGDRICALLRGGGYAEYATAPEGQCLPIPSWMNWTQAAALPEGFFTVWSNVFVEAGLQRDERFLMNGATSGIGITAVQLLSALGYDVFATAGGPKKVELVEALGAIRCVDYLSDDFSKVLHELTDGEGVNVVLELVGGDYIQKDLQCLSVGGRLVVIGAAKGLNEMLDLRPMVQKQLRLMGTLLRPKSLEYKRKIRDELQVSVWPLLEERTIEPIIDSVFPLADAYKAHSRMEARKHVGKIILEIR